jgi:hypothetical protein
MDSSLFSLAAMTIQIADSNCRLCLAERPPLQMGSKKRRDYGGKMSKRPTKI